MGQGLYIVTTWYVVETIGDMINSNRDFVGILGFHMGVNMDFMADGHPYHFFVAFIAPKGILGGAVGVGTNPYNSCVLKANQ